MTQEIHDEKATLKLRQKQRDRQWFNDNYRRLSRLYNERYIAIKNDNVIDSDPDFYALLRKLTQSHPHNDKSIRIEQITKKKPILVV